MTVEQAISHLIKLNPKLELLGFCNNGSQYTKFNSIDINLPDKNQVAFCGNEFNTDKWHIEQ